MKQILFFLLALTTLSAEEETLFSQTTHQSFFDSGPLTYTASVGSLPLLDKKGEKTGDLYYIAYKKEGEEDSSERPLTFVFNGGPGSSSVWLHMGAFGPKRILNAEEGQDVAPPYQLIDNPDSILDLTDLVFIDPVGTGFSRSTGEEPEGTLFSMNGDIEYVGDFIRDFVTKEGRWNSPKYVAGESYGTLRACGLSKYLLSKHGMYLNGLVLISCAIDFETLDVSRDNALPLTLFLPTYAATAWYHGRLPNLTLEEAISQARDFALDTFAPALFKEGFVPPHLYEEIATWTGLSSAFVQQRSGLIDDFSYFEHFKSSEKKVIGRFDSRCTGDTLPTCRYFPYYDPSAANISGIFTASFNNYLYHHLNCKSEWPRYEIFTREGHCKWKYNTNNYPNKMEALRSALLQNPSMQIFTACGYFDLATPFAAAEHNFKRLHLPREENVTFGYYEGGHMFYTNPDALKQFKNDLKSFYDRS